VVTAAPLLSLRDLFKRFPVRGGAFSRDGGEVRAVDGVSLDVPAGGTVGLVGESGCGKTTLGRLAVRLLDPDGGEIRFDGEDVTSLSGEALRRFRRQAQVIFQDPYSSLNPRMRVGEIVGEGLIVHGLARGTELKERVSFLLSRVGLSPDAATRYPHEFSGGQRQRIGIARALSLSPRLIVADEPVSALDVSVQAQVLNLLRDIQDEDGTAYLFVSHDLRVVRHAAGTVAVMYLGRIVETAPSEALFRNPLHPYTRGLLASVPGADVAERERLLPPGDVPSPVNIPTGCRFHPRCFMARPECSREDPPLREAAPGRPVACPYV
jgi:oligopeptide/dipeptide ABC transporter ATP-binding protein